MLLPSYTSATLVTAYSAIYHYSQQLLWLANQQRHSHHLNWSYVLCCDAVCCQLQVEGTCSAKHGYVLSVLAVDDISKVRSCKHYCYICYLCCYVEWTFEGTRCARVRCWGKQQPGNRQTSLTPLDLVQLSKLYAAAGLC
jgi:hypothetical protein